MILRGEGELVKTFLVPGQLPDGAEIQRKARTMERRSPTAALGRTRVANSWSGQQPTPLCP